MPLRVALSGRTKLHNVRDKYPSTWSILCHMLQQRDSWQALLLEYLDPDGRQLSASEASSITNAAEALQLWERSCTLDELLRALTERELHEVVAFLHRNLLNDPHYTPPQPPQPPQPPPLPPTLPFDVSTEPLVFSINQVQSAITHGRLIGSGGFADVYQVRLDGHDRAVKVYFPGIAENLHRAVVKSIGTLTRLRHDCIARMVGYSSSIEGRVFTVFEHYPNGDLRRLLDSFEENNWKADSKFNLASTRLRMAVDIASAIEFLHSTSERSEAGNGQYQSFHFVHKDVKPSNILLTADWSCRLADLDFLDLTTQGGGQTQEEGRRLTPVERVHTLGYCSDDPVITCRWDVFSAGVTLLELFTGLRGSPETGQPQDEWLCNALTAGREPPPTQRGLLMDADRYRRLCQVALLPCLSRVYSARCTSLELRRRLKSMLDEGPDAVEEGDACDLVELPWTDLDAAVQLAGQPLGSGGFGSVYRVELDGRALAAKRLVRPVSTEVLWRQAQLRHPHLLRLLGHATRLPDEQCLLYELCQRGTLRQLIDDFGRGAAEPASEFELAGVRVRMAYELASALDYLHRQPEWAEAADGDCRRYRMVHQDVKSSNVLLTDTWHCKLGDLDSLQAATPGTGDTRPNERPAARPFTRYGTRGYHVPDEAWTCKVDVYALGVTLLELFTGREATSATSAELRLCLLAAGHGAEPQPGLQIGRACFLDLCEAAIRPCLALEVPLRADSARVLREVERFYNCCR